LNYRESNLAVLRERYGGLADALFPGSGADAAAAVRVEAAASGDPTLSVGDLRVHSSRDPRREGARLAESLERGSGPLVILGFGLGYAAEAAGAREPDRPLVVVECRRAVLRAALECRDLRAFLSRPRLAFVLGGGDSRPGAAAAAAACFEGKPAFLKNRALTGLDAAWYAEAERIAGARASRDDVNRATLRRFGKRWVRNLAANMSAIRDAPGIAALSGCLAGSGVPVLLAAAGPSLDAAAPVLRALADRCVVVAVDTSLRFLLRNGVEPDFALTVDPQYWNFRHLDRCAAASTCLIAESAVYPPALRQPFRGALLCGSLFPLGRFIEDRVDPKGDLGAGGSVAATAWDFARLLSPAAIWIAGLDLAFPGRKTHFKGALFEERSLTESSRFAPAESRSADALRGAFPFPAPSASGGTVLTDKRLSLYAAWFESRFAAYPTLPNYSLSSGGLAIAGLIPASTQDLLAMPRLRHKFRHTLDAALFRLERDFRAPDNASARAARYDKARADLLRGLDRMARLAESAETAVPDRLDAVNRAIAASEVKDVAGFLLTPDDGWADDPARFYRALAGTIAFNLSVLKRG
jgi:hypothetical protein